LPWPVGILIRFNDAAMSCSDHRPAMLRMTATRAAWDAADTAGAGPRARRLSRRQGGCRAVAGARPRQGNRVKESFGDEVGEELVVPYDNVLGVVLNKVDMKVINHYEGYRAECYHNKDFAQYGYTD
jgi:hypothetical protein